MIEDIAGLAERLRATKFAEVSSGGYCREELCLINPDGEEAATALETLAAERDSAIRECSKWAQEAGEAKGRLEASEIAGVVAGWRERATAAEAQAATLAAENARLREAILTCDAELAEMGLQPEGRARLALRAALSPVRPVGESGRG